MRIMSQQLKPKTRLRRMKKVLDAEQMLFDIFGETIFTESKRKRMTTEVERLEEIMEKERLLEESIRARRVVAD